MKKIQFGFTLVEMMIVVAIIGILAAIALPAYQNYTKRSHVAEGLSLASGVKASVAEYYSSQGLWPTDNTAARIGNNIESNAVHGITVSNGQILIEFNHRVETGKRLLLSPRPSDSTIEWSCKPASTNGLDPKYLPSRCLY